MRKQRAKYKPQKNCGCCVETVTRALETNKVPVASKCSGRAIIRIDDSGEEKTYESIRQAAQEICEHQSKNNFQTVRKRINSVILHKTNQKAYGYFWREQD